MPSLARAVATALLAAVTSAQTWSDCNPLKVNGCPAKPGLTTDFVADFTQGGSALSQFTTTSGSVTNFDPSKGAEFKITKLGDGPTLQSNFYLFYGRVEVVMQAAPGAGIVSSWLLQSDDLDEIDWEFIGSHPSEGQSNYFGKGNTTTYDRGQTHAVSDTTSTFHTYAMDWNKDSIVWSIDGIPVRTTAYASAVGGQNFPQTPMNVRIGNWVAGDPKNNQGTIDWAGGITDFSKGPFSMWVKSVKVTNYNPAQSYSYGDMTGSSASIKLIGAVSPDQGKQSSSSSSSTSSTSVPFTSASATLPSTSASSSASASSTPPSSGPASSAGSSPTSSASSSIPFQTPSSSVARTASASQASPSSVSVNSSTLSQPSQIPSVPQTPLPRPNTISSTIQSAISSNVISLARNTSSTQSSPIPYTPLSSFPSASSSSSVPSKNLTGLAGSTSSISSKINVSSMMSSSAAAASASSSSMPYSNGTVTSSMLSASATSTMIPGGLGFGKGNFSHHDHSSHHSMSLEQPCTETSGMITLTSTITIPYPTDSTAASSMSPSSAMSSPMAGNQGNSNAQASNPGGDVFGIGSSSNAAATMASSTVSANTPQFTGSASHMAASKTIATCAGMAALVAGIMSFL